MAPLGVAGAALRFFERLHAAFREGRAPNLQALTAALERGVHSVRVREAAHGVAPLTAGGRALDAHVSLYGRAPRQPGEDDGALRARLLSSGVVGVRHTTDAGVVAYVSAALGGAAVTLTDSVTRIGRFDRLEDMATHDRMLDYGVLQRGVVRHENTPEATPGFHGRGPARPGWGPSGVRVHVALRHTPEREAQAHAALGEVLPSLSGYALAWQRELTLHWRDAVTVDDAASRTYDARTVGVWTEAPTGTVTEDFAATGAGIDGFGENFGGLPRRARRRPPPD